ncbi:hypothetical protein FOL47_008974 [Perkinsus chesapeaki]|uniref:Uncharacterized protein n=1 Tax=Perkinsus chesapeaki TaxID=330153 RepID=A0A7J6N1X3_PERCH|nr:hypothetical protein FOL47_008974 [Perkinsus chesapeaki]
MLSTLPMSSSSGQMSRLYNVLPRWRSHDDSGSLERIWRNRVDKLMLNDHWERQLRRFRGEVPHNSPRVSDRRATEESVPSLGTPLSRIFPIAAWKTNSTGKPTPGKNGSKDGEVVQMKLKEQLVTGSEGSGTPVPPKPTEVQFHPVVEARIFTPSVNPRPRRKTLPAEGSASKALLAIRTPMGVLDSSPLPKRYNGRAPRPAF